MKAKDIIDVGTITPDLLNPHLRRQFKGGGGVTVNNEEVETVTLPVTICRLATTTNIALDGTATSVDGVTVNDGDSILVDAQTTLSENGIYTAYATGWLRYSDIKPAMLVAISEGTDNSDSVWMLTSDEFVVGADDIVFEKVLPVEALPSGTVNQTLRHNGTEWEATNYIQVIDSSNNVTIGLPNNANKFGLYVEANGSGFLFNYNTAQIMFAGISGGIKRLDLGNENQGWGQVRILAKLYLKNVTANTYLGANASKEIVSIPSPNTIRLQSPDISEDAGDWANIPLLTFAAEADVTYELTLKLAFGNTSSRNASLRLFSTSAPYTYRPFILGNFAGAAPDVIYLNDSTADQPFTLDNETEFQFQTASANSVYEFKGIFLSTVNIANVQLQIKTRDVGMPIVLKDFSYLKLSR